MARAWTEVLCLGDPGIGESPEGGFRGQGGSSELSRRRPAFALTDCLSSQWLSRKGTDGSFIDVSSVVDPKHCQILLGG